MRTATKNKILERISIEDADKIALILTKYYRNTEIVAFIGNKTNEKRVSR